MSGLLVMGALGVKSALAQPAHAELRVAESEARIDVLSRGKLLLAYNKQSPPVPQGVDPVYQRSGFLHPVASPAGHIVTTTFPADHLHQHGIFSAWVDTTYDDQPVDFWNMAERTGRVVHERVVSTNHGPHTAGFEVDLIHRVENEPPVEVLRERWKLTVYATESDYHCFDLESTQWALNSKPLIVNRYHYGGLAFRGPTSWVLPNDADAGGTHDETRTDSAFLTSLGSGRLEGNHQHVRWVALTGQLDDDLVTIAVLAHADNFRAPQAVRLHPSKPYFCFAPCVDGEFVIERGRPVVNRYRYFVVDQPADAAWIDEQWRQWCGDN